MAEWTRQLAENLRTVRSRIDAAARRAGRRGTDVTLVAVTKYVPAELAAALVAEGCLDLGESRPQELWHKAQALSDTPVRWHLIGPLQRNKVRRTLPLLSLIHSGDSLRLLEEIDRHAMGTGQRIPVLLEVNVSGDQTKHGFRPDELRDLLPVVLGFPRLRIRGMMAMACRAGDLEAARHDFRTLRQLRDDLAAVAPRELSLAELSMGMSSDYEVAVEEGATIVRVGSALYEGIQL